MRNMLRTAVAALGIIGMVGGAAMLRGEDPAPTDVSRLGFLAGYWKGTATGLKSYEEQWMPPAGNTMVGCARSLTTNDKAFLEFASITVEGGAITFTPYPGGRKGALFTVKTLEENRVVFVSPQNDFPKLIEYRREKGEGGDRLIARITDGEDPPKQSMEFNLQAVAQ